MATPIEARERLIVYPYGPPRKEYEELCARFVLKLGGDVSRTIDRPFASAEAFVEHARRVASLRDPIDPEDRAIVILTRTNPLALTVVDARRRIERGVPGLAVAAWAVFVDPREDPFFADAAAKLGKVEGAMADVPIWTSNTGARFMVLSPEVTRAERVRTAIRVLIDGDG